MDRKIDVIIPYYENKPEKKQVLHKCVSSLRGHDNVIIVWNDRMGYAPAINRGLATSNADFMIVMNDDVELIEGTLDMLCVPDTVTSPTNEGRVYPYIWGSCFCIPKEVYKQIGGMDERYTISYFDDDDLIFTLQKLDIPMRAIRGVSFRHEHPGTTLDAMPDRNEFFESNKQKFLDKWGRLP